MRLQKTTVAHLVLFFISAISFWILDTQAISIGDDLGYFFSDSSIHIADGKQISNPIEIFSTQANHWNNCNGRFIIHTIVMFFLNFIGYKWFAVCNSIFFGLLCILTHKLILPEKKPTIISSFIVLLLLWLCIPRPGITMLSLAAYSINYLWTSVAILYFFILWEQLKGKSTDKFKYFIPCYALFAAALQESFSIPVSAALLFVWCINGRKISNIKIATILCFFIGTAIVFLAPGNISHAEQGGAFTISGLIAKNSALAKDLMFSSINLLAIVLIIIAVCIPSQCAVFFKRNTILLVSIITAILLATLSYTAIRQLFAPSIFSAILLGRIFFSYKPKGINNIERSIFTSGLALIYTGMIAGAYIIRQFPVMAMESIISQIKNGNSVISIPENKTEESALFNFLFSRFNDDPTVNADLKLMFDHYTKQGLGRLYSPRKSSNSVNTFLPAPKEKILSLTSNLDTTYSDKTINTVPLNKYYNIAIIPTDTSGKPKYKLASPDGHLVFERIKTNDSIIYIFPHNIKILKLKTQ